MLPVILLGGKEMTILKKTPRQNFQKLFKSLDQYDQEYNHSGKKLSSAAVQILLSCIEFGCYVSHDVLILFFTQRQGAVTVNPVSVAYSDVRHISKGSQVELVGSYQSCWMISRRFAQ